jgi:hypothetical protein
MSQQIKDTSAKLFRIVVVFCIVVIMVVLGKTPAKAQEMVEGYGSYNFADTWADENMDFIWGFGSTEAWFNSWNHESRVIMNFLSPNGTYGTYDSLFTGGYAYGHVSWPFDENNLGNYSLDVDHRNWCPVASREFAQAYTSASIRVGITNVCYQWDPAMSVGNHCEYIRQADCPVTKCKDPLFHTYTKQSSEPLCPAMFRAKRKWVEKEDACGCNITCTTVQTVQYQVPCFCTEFGMAN